MDLNQQISLMKKLTPELWDVSFQSIKVIHLLPEGTIFEPKNIFPQTTEHFKMLREMKNFKVKKIVRFRDSEFRLIGL